MNHLKKPLATNFTNRLPVGGDALFDAFSQIDFIKIINLFIRVISEIQGL
jgi:hypothetical protein